MRPRTAVLLLAATAAVAVCASACTSGGSGGASGPPRRTAARSEPPTSSAPASISSGPTTSPSPPRSAALRALGRMSLAERVGQLLMVDCPSSGLSAATSSAITDDHVGAVILDGTSSAGRDAIAGLTGRLQGLAPQGVGLFISTDQEGGEVQRLQGQGFVSIPSAVEQGGIAPSALRSDAHRWGSELRRAGVNVNLAPVLDTVPAGGGPNPPIGDLDREYGHTPGTVSSHGVAFLRGMAAAGVDATGKHFPGLGRVAGNTDTSAGVVDTVTTRHDPYLAPYRAAARAGVPFMMVSSAIYARIDPNTPAVFSKTIVTGMLRRDLGFRGVIITDDVGAAAQVGGYPVGARAVDFVKAGGDMVLTVDASQAGTMTAALLAAGRSSSAFRAKVNAAALKVLEAKQARGLVK